MVFDLDAEIRSTRGRILGEAVWRRTCQLAGADPKAPELLELHGATVVTVQAAFMVLDESGFVGLNDWLDLEEGALGGP